MDEAHDEVGDPEQDGFVPERLRHGQRHDQHRRGRGEHRQPDATLVHIHCAGQRGVGRPGPPERREHEHPSEDAVPGRVVREQLRGLGDREHEHQVEEELERGDLVLEVGVGNGIDNRHRL